MTSFNNNDLYQIVLDRLRKDRKGSISPEEFESFLRLRNLDYFNQQMPIEGDTKLNEESLRVFLVERDEQIVSVSKSVSFISLSPVALIGTTTTDTYQYLSYHLKNLFHSSSTQDHSSAIEVDILSASEIGDRLNNAITAPSATEPIGYYGTSPTGAERIYLYGVSSGYGLVTYYRYPLDPYFDYYTDNVGNVTYLTDGQGSYTLQAGEVARDGSTAGQGVTSASVDLEWEDYDAMNILDMVMSDIAVAQTDESSYQASILERKNNVKS
jgi:hypothetical protein